MLRLKFIRTLLMVCLLALLGQGLTAQENRGLALVTAAKQQIGETLYYDPSYVSLSFPGGDVPRESGVCTDVVIRALRDAFDIDLQKLVNKDMKAAFHTYPKTWGLSRTDYSIDHRRVPNLRHFFKRHGFSLSPSMDGSAYKAGDIVSWLLPSNLTHIGIVSDKLNASGNAPLVIHNIGSGTQEEDILFDFKITGHYRLK